MEWLASPARTEWTNPTLRARHGARRSGVLDRLTDHLRSDAIRWVSLALVTDRAPLGRSRGIGVRERLGGPLDHTRHNDRRSHGRASALVALRSAFKPDAIR